LGSNWAAVEDLDLKLRDCDTADMKTGLQGNTGRRFTLVSCSVPSDYVPCGKR
jgi:hypothetical protein